MRSSFAIALFALLACSSVARAATSAGASRAREVAPADGAEQARRRVLQVAAAAPPPGAQSGALAGVGPFGAWLLLTSVANSPITAVRDAVLPGVYGVYGGGGGPLATARQTVDAQVQDVLGQLTQQFQGLQDNLARGTTSGQDIFCGAWEGLQLAGRMFDTLSAANPIATRALAGNVGTFLQASNLLVPQAAVARYSEDCKAFAPRDGDTLSSYLTTTLGDTPFTAFLKTTLEPLDTLYQQAQAQAKKTTTTTTTTAPSTGLAGWLQNLTAPATGARADGLGSSLIAVPPWLRLLANSTSAAPTPTWGAGGAGLAARLANATTRLSQAAAAPALFRRQP